MSNKNLFRTDFNQEELENDLLGGSLASVKEKMLEESENHVKKIDKKDDEEQKQSKRQYLNEILFGSRKVDFETDLSEDMYRAVRLLMNSNLQKLFELSKVQRKFKVSTCINNLIDSFVEQNIDEIEKLIEVSRINKNIGK